jgi:hypothetical protein
MISLAAVSGAVAFGVWTKRRSKKVRPASGIASPPAATVQDRTDLDDDQAADLIRRALPELERARREV